MRIISIIRIIDIVDIIKMMRIIGIIRLIGITLSAWVSVLNPIFQNMSSIK